MSSLRTIVLLLSLSLVSETEQAFAPTALPHVLPSARQTCLSAPKMMVAPVKERVEFPDHMKIPISAPAAAQGAWNCEGGVCRPRGLPSPSSPQPELRSDSSPLEQLLGADLELVHCATNGPAPLSTLPTSGVIAVYFSAHWCPPCQRFQPKLLETYQNAQRENKPMEVVMVCADRKEEEYANHVSGLPWRAVSWAQKSKLGKLMGSLKVGGLPSLVLLDAATGAVITRDGRRLLASDPLALNYPWTEPAGAAPAPTPPSSPARSPSRASVRPPLPHRRFAPIGRGMPPLPIKAAASLRTATVLASSSSSSDFSSAPEPQAPAVVPCAGKIAPSVTACKTPCKVSNCQPLSAALGAAGAEGLRFL